MEILDQIETNFQLTPRQKEAAAQKMGFNNYNEMILFEKARSRKHESAVKGTPKKPVAEKKPAQQQPRGNAMDFVSRIMEAFDSVLKKE